MTPTAPTGGTIGVLFVHGMGTHPPGETLRTFADPLVDWLANGHVLESLRVTDTDLTPGPDVPASVRCELDPVSGAGRRTWILAESCWSASFEEPSYLKIAYWLIASVPWMIGDYMRGAWQRGARRGRKDKPRWYVSLGRWGLIPGYFVAGALLAGPIILLLALLPIAGLIPIAWVQKQVSAIPRALAATLGDVYVILATRVDAAAIADRIVRDHKWLAKQCASTVIVAHSAGAAVTHDLIRERRLSNAREVGGYITLGEAIWRMQWMRQLSRSGAWRVIGIALAVVTMLLMGGGVAVLVLIAPAAGTAGWVPYAAWGALAFAFAVHLTMQRLIIRWSRKGEQDRQAAIRELNDTRVRGSLAERFWWHDYVASSDPVPAGALSEPAHATTPRGRATTRGCYQSFGVQNKRSILFDHQSYPANLEQFIAGMGRDLAKVAGVTLAIPPKQLVIDGRCRAARTLSLALIRLHSATVAAIVMLAVLCEHRTDDVGRRLGWLTRLLKTLPWTSVTTQIRPERVGLAVAVLALVASWLLAVLAWRLWDGRARKNFMDRRSNCGCTSIGVTLTWLIGTAAASVFVLRIADLGSGSLVAWVATGPALAIGGLRLWRVDKVLAYRNRAYGPATQDAPTA